MIKMSITIEATVWTNLMISLIGLKKLERDEHHSESQADSNDSYSKGINLAVFG